MIMQMTVREALLLNEPKYLILDGNKATVYTGDDIPLSDMSSRSISVQEFRDRFTKSEILAFLTATTSDIDAKELDWKLSTRTDLLNLDSADVIQGMSYLVSIGVITEQRKAEILT